MATLSLQVTASADDCIVLWNGSIWSLSATSTWMQTGYDYATAFKKGGGMRFLNVTIPNGSTIIAAYLTFRCSTSYDATVVNTRITGEDVDTATTFGIIADYQARRGTVVGGANDNYITTAQVDWDAIPAWTLDTDYNSPEIKTIIQEIIDRAGWASGNNMVLFWDDHDGRCSAISDCFRVAYSYNGDTTYCPKLYIEYTPPVTFIPTVTII